MFEASLMTRIRFRLNPNYSVSFCITFFCYNYVLVYPLCIYWYPFQLGPEHAKTENFFLLHSHEKFSICVKPELAFFAFFVFVFDIITFSLLKSNTVS